MCGELIGSLRFCRKQARVIVRTPEFKSFLEFVSRNPDNNAQMENIVQVQKTTTFYEGNDVEKADIIEHIPRTILNPAPDVSLQNFMERPIIVKDIEWSSTHAFGANLDTAGTLLFPSLLLTNSTLFNKLDHIYLMRPDIEITIRLNTTMMHYGRLLFAVYPMPMYMNNEYMQWRNASGAEWYQITANKDQSVSFVVPYRSCYDWMDLTVHDTETVRHLFKLVPYVSAPLSMATGTPPKVSVQIYARFVNPRLCGYTHNSLVAQMDTPSQEVIHKSEKGLLVSDGVKAAGDFITCFEDVPVIGEYARPIGKSLRKSAKMLKEYGYNVPVNASSITPVAYKSVLYNTVDDNPLSIKLGSAQDMGLSKDSEMVHDELDAMNILHMCQRPFLLFTGKITSANTTGQYLWEWPVSPSNIINGDYNSMTGATQNVNNNAFYPSIMQYLAGHFGMWRGSIRLAFSFISSSFHSCRLRLVWNPVNVGNILPDYNESQDCFNVTFDINQQTDYCVTIPYMQELHWLLVKDFDMTSTTLGATNGVIGLQLLTDLTSSSSTVNPIYFQVFASAGADFQLALPSMDGKKSYGVAQMDKIESNIPTSSHIKLMKASYPPIGGIQAGVTSTNRNTSYAIKSVKQLINGLTPIMKLPDSRGATPGLAANTDSYSFTISPFGSYSLTGTGFVGYSEDLFYQNMYLSLRLLFMFHRGSTRISVVSDATSDSTPIIRSTATVPGAPVGNIWTMAPKGLMLEANMKYNIGTPSIPNIISYNGARQSLFDGFYDNINRSTGYALGTVVNKNQLDVVLPYFSAMNNKLNMYDNQTSSPNDGLSVTFTCPGYTFEFPLTFNQGVGVGGQGNVYCFTEGYDTTSAPVGRVNRLARSIKYVVFLSASDDYIMGVQLPVPINKVVGHANSGHPIKKRKADDKKPISKVEDNNQQIEKEKEKEKENKNERVTRDVEIQELLKTLESDGE